MVASPTVRFFVELYGSGTVWAWRIRVMTFILAQSTYSFNLSYWFIALVFRRKKVQLQGELVGIQGEKNTSMFQKVSFNPHHRSTMPSLKARISSDDSVAK